MVGAYGSGDCFALYQHLLEKYSFSVLEVRSPERGLSSMSISPLLKLMNQWRTVSQLTYPLPNAALMEWQASVASLPKDHS